MVASSRRLGALLLGACLSCAASGEAGQIDYDTTRLGRSLPAARAVGAITVDGTLNEPDWMRAPIANGFIQSDPREGEPASDAREWSSNVRFDIIHRPLSDFFLVFNERRDSETGGLLDRALVAKMTYLVAF